MTTHHPIAATALLGLTLPPGQITILCLSIALVICCVLVHYEALRLLTALLVRLKALHRVRILALILGLLAAHVVEVWIYALAYGAVDGHTLFGTLKHTVQPTDAAWLDYVYFSFVTFTTVGYGDFVPTGPIRFIAATEALNGWVLLGWSVSFTFLEMQRFWRTDGKVTREN